MLGTLVVPCTAFPQQTPPPGYTPQVPDATRRISQMVAAEINRQGEVAVQRRADVNAAMLASDLLRDKPVGDGILIHKETFEIKSGTSDSSLLLPKEIVVNGGGRGQGVQEALRNDIMSDQLKATANGQKTGTATDYFQKKPDGTVVKTAIVTPQQKQAARKQIDDERKALATSQTAVTPKVPPAVQAPTKPAGNTGMRNNDGVRDGGGGGGNSRSRPGIDSLMHGGVI